MDCFHIGRTGFYIKYIEGERDVNIEPGRRESSISNYCHLLSKNGRAIPASSGMKYSIVTMQNIVDTFDRFHDTVVYRIDTDSKDVYPETY